MSKASVFQFKSYKDVMAHYLSGAGKRGQITRAAESLGCQASYLSRVMSEDLHLTPDHAYRLSRFWQLSRDEREYFMLLVEYERASDRDYKSDLHARLQSLQQKHESVPERTQRKNLSIEAHQIRYFSHWHMSAVHFLTSVPEFQTVSALSERLGLSQTQIQRTLEELEAMGFIKRKGAHKWAYAGGEFHAPKDSPLVLLHHQNWRSRAVFDAQDPTQRHVHFTAVQTVSRKDVDRIRELVLEFLERFSSIANPSSPEEGIALTCDFFKV